MGGGDPGAGGGGVGTKGVGSKENDIADKKEKAGVNKTRLSVDQCPLKRRWEGDEDNRDVIREGAGGGT